MGQQRPTELGLPFHQNGVPTFIGWPSVSRDVSKGRCEPVPKAPRCTSTSVLRTARTHRSRSRHRMFQARGMAIRRVLVGRCCGEWNGFDRMVGNSWMIDSWWYPELLVVPGYPQLPPSIWTDGPTPGQHITAFLHGPCAMRSGPSRVWLRTRGFTPTGFGSFW